MVHTHTHIPILVGMILKISAVSIWMGKVHIKQWASYNKWNLNLMKCLKVIKAECSSQHLGCNNQKANGLEGVMIIQLLHPFPHKRSWMIQPV